MNKSPILSLAVAMVLATPAIAADQQARTIAPPAYNWAGWYMGGNLGYGWGRNTGGDWDSFVDPGSMFGIDLLFSLGGNVLPGVKPNGAIGGGQIGYNWQTSANWVWGLVADIQASDMHGSASATVTPPASATLVESNSSKIEWFGTVRGRLGYAADNWLFYGTGGLAYGRVASTLEFNAFNLGGWINNQGSNSAIKTGWTAGAGIEVALTRNWTIGVEYLHIDLGSISTPVKMSGVFAGRSVTANSGFAADIVRGTVNFKF